ncbi:MAG TPA: APC family permease [Gemmatimonadales bacterium]|nr:APC family permease [Gemmatimonadales bacterium]
MSDAPQLRRVMGLRDVVLFNITAIVGLRWLTTASFQFGFAAIPVWILAMLVFFVPSAVAVRELTDIDPGAGGIYRWVTRAYGPRHGFLAGWGYWVNNLTYFPSLLLSAATILAYIGGRRTAWLGEHTSFTAVVSLVGLWFAIWLNLVGLRIGKWLQNAGGIGTWIPALLFVLLAAWAFINLGSATPFHVHDLVPARLDLPSINLFGTMTFAFAGLELAPSLGGEIHDPAATLRRGVLVSGFAIAATYVVGTLAILVALPHETVSITNGMPQAAQALAERLGGGWLLLLPPLIVVLLTFGNLGGTGAWLAGCARLPFAAGVDKALPPAFARLHPRWGTPYVSLLVMGGLATLFIIASLAGETVRAAYLLLTQLTVALFFIPYLYIFGAYLRLRRARTLGTGLLGVLGIVAVALSIVLSFIPPADEASPLGYVAKIGGGVVLFMGVGWWLARRSARAGGRTAEAA